MVHSTAGNLRLPVPDDSDPMALLPETIRDLADQLELMVPGWSGYTAAWTAATTNPSMGNAVATVQQQQIGLDTMLWYVEITMGTTTTYGSGQWRMSLPKPGIQSPATGRIWFPVHGFAFDLSANDSWPMRGHVANTGGGAYVVLQCPATSAGGSDRPVSSSVPFTWANGDVLTLWGIYRTDGS